MIIQVLLSLIEGQLEKECTAPSILDTTGPKNICVVPELCRHARLDQAPLNCFLGEVGVAAVLRFDADLAAVEPGFEGELGEEPVVH